jgi:hypothetical protein
MTQVTMIYGDQVINLKKKENEKEMSLFQYDCSIPVIYGMRIKRK